MQRRFVFRLRCENQLRGVVEKRTGDFVVAPLTRDVDRGLIAREVRQWLTSGSGEEALNDLQSLS